MIPGSLTTYRQPRAKQSTKTHAAHPFSPSRRASPTLTRTPHATRGGGGDGVRSVARYPNKVLLAKGAPAYRSLSKPNRPSTIGARRSSMWTNHNVSSNERVQFFDLTVPSAERNRKTSIAILCTLRCEIHNALTTCGTEVSISRFGSVLTCRGVNGKLKETRRGSRPNLPITRR